MWITNNKRKFNLTPNDIKVYNFLKYCLENPERLFLDGFHFYVFPVDEICQRLAIPQSGHRISTLKRILAHAQKNLNGLGEGFFKYTISTKYPLPHYLATAPKSPRKNGRPTMQSITINNPKIRRRSHLEKITPSLHRRVDYHAPITCTMTFANLHQTPTD